MKNSPNFKQWEPQARRFFGDDFWEDILSVIPDVNPETPAPEPNSQKKQKIQPAYDLFRTEKQIIVHIELPGLQDVASVDMYMEDGRLVVSGTLKRSFSPQQTVVGERAIGSFQRVIPIPETVQENGIRANYRNGLLEVTLPRRSPNRRKRRIPIHPQDT